jgi:hypothetical protein
MPAPDTMPTEIDLRSLSVVNPGFHDAVTLPWHGMKCVGLTPKSRRCGPEIGVRFPFASPAGNSYKNVQDASGE